MSLIESPQNGESDDETTTATESVGGVLRRTVLKTSAVVVGALMLNAPVAAGQSRSDDDSATTDEVDEPEGFSVEVLAPHATFPDSVAAGFVVDYEGSDSGPITSLLPFDASSVVLAKVTWQPGGTSGWHTHPGPVVVTITEGELELINERDCVTRTYTAGEAFIDPGQGNVHIAANPSTTEQAVAYATFLGVPDGKPATIWVEPVEC
ncbi:cupin domain-containing protein [Halomarina litorea]|uniref:cupin domain-containing protein n=1 Tax=Halomarina litorea TaxID=2961595 RepID=UPI0020C53968|nr:cupin domain-containing protein [Halomarina sp. BCD28]